MNASLKISGFLLLSAIVIAMPLESCATSQLINIHYGHYPGYARFVFDFNEPVDYQADQQQDKQALILTFTSCAAAKYRNSFKHNVADSIVQSIYLERITDKDLAVGIKMNHEFRYQIYTIKNPWRMVLDLYHKNQNNAKTAAAVESNSQQFKYNLASKENQSPDSSAHSVPLYKIIIYSFIIHCLLFALFIFKVKKPKFGKYQKVIPCNSPEPAVQSNFKTIIEQNINPHSNGIKSRGIRKTAAVSSTTVDKILNEYQPDTQYRKNIIGSIQSLREEVENLYNEQDDIKTIAQKLHLGQDEVQLILNLNQKQKRFRKRPASRSRLRFEFA